MAINFDEVGIENIPSRIFVDLTKTLGDDGDDWPSGYPLYDGTDVVLCTEGNKVGSSEYPLDFEQWRKYMSNVPAFTSELEYYIYGTYTSTSSVLFNFPENSEGIIKWREWDKDSLDVNAPYRFDVQNGDVKFNTQTGNDVDILSMDLV